MQTTDKIEIYVYGSCHFTERLDSDENIGTGGYGIIIRSNGQKIKELSGGFSNTTNARMDIIGIIEGLKEISTPSNITIYLTNAYVVDSIAKGWLNNWEKSGFKNRKHGDLWRMLAKVINSNNHSISCFRASNVRYTPDYKQAELLGKAMSGKLNLPVDLSEQPEIPSLFNAESKLKTEIQNIETTDSKPILDSVCVDASSIQNPGITEYRGVNTKTGEVLFEVKLEEATNNIGEFLAIVHVISLYKKQNKELPILYSDSQIAISWVKQKVCKTKMARNDNNQKTFELLERAVKWLQKNDYKTKILKWNTNVWGEIPADYGRK